MRVCNDQQWPSIGCSGMTTPYCCHFRKHCKYEQKRVFLRDETIVMMDPYLLVILPMSLAVFWGHCGTKQWKFKLFFLARSYPIKCKVIKYLVSHNTFLLLLMFNLGTYSREWSSGQWSFSYRAATAILLLSITPLSIPPCLPQRPFSFHKASPRSHFPEIHVSKQVHSKNVWAPRVCVG